MQQPLDPEHVLLRPGQVQVVVVEQRPLSIRVEAALAGERVAGQLVDADEDKRGNNHGGDADEHQPLRCVYQRSSAHVPSPNNTAEGGPPSWRAPLL